MYSFSFDLYLYTSLQGSEFYYKHPMNVRNITEAFTDDKEALIQMPIIYALICKEVNL